jgi:hypothetical protein
MRPKTLAEIYDTTPMRLTRAEIAQLDEQSRAWALWWKKKHLRQQSCPAHERELVGDPGGWHRLRCKYCGMDMASYNGG